MSKNHKSRPDLEADGKSDPKPEIKPDMKPNLRRDSKPDKAARPAAADKRDEWSEVANFVITFERRGAQAAGTLERRISAHKMQDGGISARWSGVAQQPMAAWMAEHVGDWADDEAPLPGAPASAEAGRAARPTATDAATAAAAAARATDNTSISIQNFRVRGQADAAFDLEADIEVECPVGAKARLLPPCSVSFFSRNVANHDKAALGTIVVDGLAPGRKSYRARLPAVKLPAGEYRLESVALLKGAATKVAYKAGPVLHVG